MVTDTGRFNRVRAFGIAPVMLGGVKGMEGRVVRVLKDTVAIFSKLERAAQA